ncbi:helix-turn-helix domain-containing protein [Photobacterium leiognathi]|uniref:helix-turn-helix domain-containing protein n=1 Tax=Photobacterium leiognathi TaxID=553611 RepID=UPI0029813281|nr:helix-turn-helix domain-containing protein [Photobacterium leiognathi]
MSFLAKKICDAINNSSYSKSEIARRLNVSRPTVQAWTTKGTISMDNLKRLSFLLGIPINYFLTSELPEEDFKEDAVKQKIKYLVDQVEDKDRVVLDIILKILS